MSGHVDTWLPEGFLHERLMEAQRAPVPAVVGQPFGSLVDFYKEPLHELCSSFYWKPPEPKRKSSSLKTNRSPASNGEKKIVRFADVMGLDLADVHTFLDEIPRIPKSAFKDLKDKDRPSKVNISPQLSRRIVSQNNGTRSEKNLVALFQQPASKPDFLERIKTQKVCLENAFVTHTNALNIRGTIRVANLDYHKSVTVRYTVDKWRTHKDIPCQYLESCNDGGFSDRFNFTLPGNNVVSGDRVELAFRYVVNTGEFWDSNKGANYGFQCIDEGKSAGGTIPSQANRLNDVWTNSSHSWAY